MFYIWDLAAHEAFGPFTTRERAHKYAKAHCKTYQVLSDKAMQEGYITANLRLVPESER